MDMLALTHDEIKAALVEGYEAEYDEYKRWADAVPELAREDENAASEAANRMANNRSHRLDGYKAAAEALGIPGREFLEAVSQNGKEGDSRCQ